MGFLRDTSTRTALVSDGRRVSYQNLADAAARISHMLLADSGRDHLAGARIAFQMPAGPEAIAMFLGIWQAGGVAVPIATTLPPAEADYIVRDAEAQRIGAKDVAAATRHPAARLPEIAADHPALILYTSGTTGKPKGVVSTHGQMAAQISCLVDAWQWTADDRALLVLPLHHVHGLINVVGSALWCGASVEVMPRVEPTAVWARLASGEITMFTAVPTIYHRLIEAFDASPETTRQAWARGASGLRLMMSGSAALPVRTLERWQAITGHVLLERYGMTEIGMALSNPLHGDRRAGQVGVPLPGVSIRVVDEAGAEVAAGAAGEIEVRGPGVFREYWRRPDETARAFRDGWFRTGDVAVVEDGRYRLLGRTSIDIIKTGGEKVSALEIEDALREHPAIADCAVVGLPDPEWGEVVSVAVELKPGQALTLPVLRDWTSSRLAPGKRPRRLVCVPSLPRNAMGKVVKPDVRGLFEP